jgi:hypothetical protein
MAMCKGSIPYSDIFDHKPPMLYIFNALFYKIFNGNLWGIHGLIVLLNSISSVMIFKDSYRYSKSFLLAFLISLLFISLMNNYTLMGVYNLTRQFCVFWIVFFLHVYNSNFISLKIQLMVLSFLSVIIFFTQQNEVLCILPFLFHRTFDQKHLIIKNLFWLFIGFILSTSVFIGLFIYWGNFTEFLNQNFSFNLSSYVKPIPVHIRMYEMLLQIIQLSKRVWGIPIIICFASFLLLKHYSKNKHKISVFFLLSLIFEYYACTLSGRTYGHYLLVFIPLLIYTAIIHSEGNELKTNSVKFLVFLVFIQFFVDVYKYHKVWLKYSYPQNQIYASLTNSINQNTIKDFSAFYTFETPYLRVNYELNTLSPSKYVYSHFNDTLVNNVILNDLNHHNTKYVFCSDVKLNSNKNIERFINSNYMVIKSFKVQEPIPTTLRLYSHK